MEEEGEQIRRFLRLLESSGVGLIVDRYVKNESPRGGRPSVNYHRLLATVLYGFSTGRATLRSIADSCAHDVRFIAMMQQCRPDYSTIAKFINKVIVPNEAEIFARVTKAAAAEMGARLDDAFVDGSKFEANANKYKFVWKPTTFHERVSSSFHALCRGSGLLKGYSEERICGPGRKSYFKTDRDATAMCLKSDYYSGLGTNMHAAYNVQLVVCRGIVAAYAVTQSRADVNDFAAAIEAFFAIHGRYPANVCADAGYGSPGNYSFLKARGIGNFVKDQSWEGNASGSRPDCYRMRGGAPVCLAGRPCREREVAGRHPKKPGGRFYSVTGCRGCPFHDYCFRFVRNGSGADEKVFEINLDCLALKAEAEANLLSPKGIELRVNRSIQVEGAFGILKHDYGYERMRRRGIARVSTEVMLNALGLTVAKLFRFYETGKTPDFWEAPPEMAPQAFKKPSAKRLSKKGRKIHEKAFAEKEHA